MQTFWEGGECANLGFGTRTKKIGFIGFKVPWHLTVFGAFTQDLIYGVCVQVYNVALYVEADPAKATLQLSDPSTDSVCSALLNGQFQKVLQIHMLRDVTSTQFKDGLRENLVPNLKKYGGDEHLETFMDFFSDKKIGNGSEIPLLWSGNGHSHGAGLNCHAPYVMHVAVPSAHRLSCTKLEKSHSAACQL